MLNKSKPPPSSSSSQNNKNNVKANENTSSSSSSSVNHSHQESSSQASSGYGSQPKQTTSKPKPVRIIPFSEENSVNSLELPFVSVYKVKMTDHFVRGNRRELHINNILLWPKCW